MDIYDGADWTEMDIEDLRAAIEGGATIQEAADLLCRADGVEEVARKCEELGLKPEQKGLPSPPDCAMTADQHLILDAIEQAQHILAGYVEPGPRNPERTIEELISALARPELVAAVQRVRAGYGLRVVM
jgi:hypothetical protein